MKLTPLTAFNVSFQYFTDILQHIEYMHIKLDAKIVLDKFTGFELGYVQTTAQL